MRGKLLVQIPHEGVRGLHGRLVLWQTASGAGDARRLAVRRLCGLDAKKGVHLPPQAAIAQVLARYHTGNLQPHTRLDPRLVYCVPVFA